MIQEINLHTGSPDTPDGHIPYDPPFDISMNSFIVYNDLRHRDVCSPRFPLILGNEKNVRNDLQHESEKEGFPVNGSRMVSLAVMVALGTTLGGCCGGGKTVVQQPPPQTIETKSTGEQLIDLQKAYESGAIDEKQYNKMKQDLIDKAEKK